MKNASHTVSTLFLLGFLPTAVIPCFGQSGSFEQVSGSLSQISVGADGAVWGLDSSQNIFTWDSSTSQFVQIPGALAQIAVGNANAVWGLNGGGYIYRWDASTQSWTSIPGQLTQIAVGADGDVWGLNSTYQVYHYDQPAQAWDYIDTSYLFFQAIPPNRQLFVGNVGSVYMLVSLSLGAMTPLWYNPGSGRFQRLVNGNGGPYQSVPNPLSFLAVGADGDLWGGLVPAHYSPLEPQWDVAPAPPGGYTITQLAVGSAANVWGIAYQNGAQPVFQYDAQSGAWVSAGIMLKQIAAGADGSAWGVDSQNHVYRYTGTTQPYNILRPITGSVQQISVAADGTAWAVDASNLIYSFDRQTQSWQNVPGALAQVSLPFTGGAWGVNAGGAIWVLDSALSPGAQGWTNIPGELNQISVGANGAIFGINASGQTYTFSDQNWFCFLTFFNGSCPGLFPPQGWTNIPGALVQLSTGADGTAWGINAQQQIYQYDSSTNSWTHIPGALVQISVGNAANVWGVNANGQVYRYDASVPGWDVIPNAFLSQIAVAFDGAVWGVNAEDSLYQWNSATHSFNFVANGVTNVAVGHDSAVFAWNTHTGASYWYF
jgi:virginiamycin B lyase